MDILSQYKQEHPEAFQEKKPLPLTDEYGRTYTGMVGLVMRLSGGRIRDANQASKVLLVGTVVIGAVALYLFIRAFSSPRPSGPIIPVAGPKAN